jgi:hypothetical protein
MPMTVLQRAGSRVWRVYAYVRRRTERRMGRGFSRIIFSLLQRSRKVEFLAGFDRIFPVEFD